MTAQFPTTQPEPVTKISDPNCGKALQKLTRYKEQRKALDLEISNLEQRFKKFYHSMLKQGVYLAPSAFEGGFMSAAHSEQDIEDTLAAAKIAFSELSA